MFKTLAEDPMLSQSRRYPSVFTPEEAARFCSAQAVSGNRSVAARPVGKRAGRLWAAWMAFWGKVDVILWEDR